MHAAWRASRSHSAASIALRALPGGISVRSAARSQPACSAGIAASICIRTDSGVSP
jgi:hypothetical protein